MFPGILILIQLILAVCSEDKSYLIVDDWQTKLYDVPAGTKLEINKKTHLAYIPEHIKKRPYEEYKQFFEDHVGFYCGPLDIDMETFPRQWCYSRYPSVDRCCEGECQCRYMYFCRCVKNVVVD